MWPSCTPHYCVKVAQVQFTGFVNVAHCQFASRVNVTKSRVAVSSFLPMWLGSKVLKPRLLHGAHSYFRSQQSVP
jgi:hypothetical protein